MAADKQKIFRISILTLGVIAFLFIGYKTFTGFRSPTAELSRTRVMIDAATGDIITRFRLEDGMSMPYPHPRTGERTVWPAEACFWTADGKAKLEPTYVLLNEFVGKPGPTKCPDCGRDVVRHNPMPPDELILEAAGRS